MATFPATTGGNAATPPAVAGLGYIAFESNPNGSIEVIGSADDGDFAAGGSDNPSGTTNYAAAWALNNTPGDFGTMNSLSFRARYRKSATNSDISLSDLRARILTSNGSTVLAGASSTPGSSFQTFVSGAITGTSFANSTLTAFTFVNDTADQTAWDGAILEIGYTRTRSKGGGTQTLDISAAEVSGDYDAAVASDDLLADDVESASEVTSPSVGQEHALLADDVQSTSELTSPAVGQVHALLADDAESASEVTAPALVEVTPLLADDVESATGVSAPALGQEHGLLADDTESASELTSPAVGQEHALLADDVEGASELTSPAVGQVHALLADDAEAASELTSPSLAEASGTDELTAGDVETSSEVTSPGIGQIHALLANDVESITLVSEPSLDGDVPYTGHMKKAYHMAVMKRLRDRRVRRENL